MRAIAHRGGQAAKLTVPLSALTMAWWAATELPRDWGSGCGGDFGERVVRGEEALPKADAERAVVDGAADLEQPIGTAPRPAHLLRFGHAPVDEEVGCSL